jgi:hypothetical protein
MLIFFVVLETKKQLVLRQKINESNFFAFKIFPNFLYVIFFLISFRYISIIIIITDI